VVSWPAKFKGERRIHAPVISLDILPTVLDAAGVDSSSDPAFDGKSLLPLLNGESHTHHATLYWNSGEPKGEWAVRQGDWKAHGFKERSELFNLADDPSEKSNVALEHPEMMKKLIRLHSSWHQSMKESASGINKSQAAESNVESTPSNPKENQRKKRQGRRKNK
jgi:arylsulfatase A-like enzyme